MANAESVEGNEDCLKEEDEPEESEDAIPQTGEEIVSASLLSGSLSDACIISTDARPLDIEENELVKNLFDHGCTYDLGPTSSHAASHSQQNTTSLSAVHLLK